MATQGSFLGIVCSQSLYTLDIARRVTNVGGLTHGLMRRKNLKRALASTEPTEHPVRHAMLDHAIAFRQGARVMTVPLDLLIGTGSHRRMPGESRRFHELLMPPSGGEGSELGRFAHAAKHPLGTASRSVRFHLNLTHEQRVKYLSRRFEQSIKHPCDTGLLGLVGAWLSAPFYTAASLAGAAVGAAGATVVYGAMAMANKRPGHYSDFVSRWAAAAAGGAAATMFGTLMTAPLWYTVQGLRAATAGVKGLLTVAGASVGLLVGLAVVGARAMSASTLQPQTVPALPAGVAPIDAGNEADTFVEPEVPADIPIIAPDQTAANDKPTDLEALSADGLPLAAKHTKLD